MNVEFPKTDKLLDIVTLLDTNDWTFTLLKNVETPITFNWLHNVTLLLTLKLQLTNTFPCKYDVFNIYKLLDIVALLVTVKLFTDTLLLIVTGPKMFTPLQNVTLLLNITGPRVFNKLHKVSCCCIVTLLQKVVLL